MADKLNGDGLWATRMMLPEHKEAILRQNREPLKRTKPTLDPQELELIERVIAESYREHRTVSLRLFDEYGPVEVRGIITAVQTYRREIKLCKAEGEWQWIRMDAILSAEI